jgi:hypothetical protein
MSFSTADCDPIGCGGLQTWSIRLKIVRPEDVSRGDHYTAAVGEKTKMPVAPGVQKLEVSFGVTCERIMKLL